MKKLISKEAKIISIREASAMMLRCPHFNKDFIYPLEGAILAMKIADNLEGWKQEIHLVQKGKSANAAILLIETENAESKTEFLNEKTFKELFEVNYM